MNSEVAYMHPYYNWDVKIFGLNTRIEHKFKGLGAKIATGGFLHPQC